MMMLRLLFGSFTVFTLASCVVDGGTEVESLLLQGDELVIDSEIDSSSRNWRHAPFLHEISHECPIREDAYAFAVSHEAHSVTAGADMTIDVTIEGRHFDPGLTGQPHMLVYRGPLPADDASARDCVDHFVKNQVEGLSGQLTDIEVAEGEQITIVAFTLGMMPFPSEDAGTYRVRVSAR